MLGIGKPICVQDGDGLHGCGRACVGEKVSARRELAIAIGTATLPGKRAGQSRSVIDRNTRVCKIPLSFRSSGKTATFSFSKNRHLSTAEVRDKTAKQTTTARRSRRR